MIDSRSDLERALVRVQRRYRPAFETAKAKARAVMERYAKRNESLFRRIASKEESPAAVVNSISRDSQWIESRLEIALDLYDADTSAVKVLNDSLAEFFADGANLASYRLRSSEYEPLPYTEKIVQSLARSALIRLPQRRVDRGKLVGWSKRQLQSILTSAAIAGTPTAKMSRYVADRIVSQERDMMDATAAVVAYGSFDAGLYQAGLDAKAEGLEIEKTWLAIIDNRVRDSHSRLHLTTIPIDELFHGDRGTLRYPHDPRAEPAELYNCRCHMAVHLAGKAPKSTEVGIKPTEKYRYRRWRAGLIAELGGEVALEQRHRRRLHASMEG